jgi:glycosyltransferase involved in cell wall biosynthesis
MEKASPTLEELPDPPDGKTGWPWTEQGDPLPKTRPDGSPWPKISIVTPSYNQGQFIEETIRSVLLQGYPNLEYIVMDGGSDDNTIEILERYDPWIDRWVSKDDGGQANAINKGLSQARGKVAAYLNSDDMYLPGALNHVGKTYAEEEFDVFVGRRKTENAQFTDKFKPRHPRSSLIGYLRQFRPFHDPYWSPQGSYDLPQECILWDNRKYEDKRFNENYEFIMDAEWFIRIFSGAKVAYSSREVGIFRRHDDQKTTQMDEVFKKEANKINKKYAYCINKVSKYSQIKRSVKFFINLIKYFVIYLTMSRDCVVYYKNESYL